MTVIYPQRMGVIVKSIMRTLNEQEEATLNEMETAVNGLVSVLKVQSSILEDIKKLLVELYNLNVKRVNGKDTKTTK